MQDITDQIITNVIDDFVSNPFRPLEENRKHHERILHYLHGDYCRRNLDDLLTDPLNKIKNKFIIYFFRCNDFGDRDNIQNTIDRIDTVVARSKKISDIMFEVCNTVKTNSLKAIFVEIFLINQQIEAQIKRFSIANATILTKKDIKVIMNLKTKTFNNLQLKE